MSSYLLPNITAAGYGSFIFTVLQQTAMVKKPKKTLDDQREKIKNLSPNELAVAPDGIVIAYNFIRLREAKGMTQEKLAESEGVSTGYIGKVETAKVSFSTRAQTKWARRFGVHRSEFLKRPDIGIAVRGVIVDRGRIHPPEDATRSQLEYVPLPPGYSQIEASKQGVYGLAIRTENLYPHLKPGWILYVKPVPVESIRNDDYVIIAQADGSRAVKEVERIHDAILLKGLGKSDTIQIKETDRESLDLVFHFTRIDGE